MRLSDIAIKRDMKQLYKSKKTGYVDTFEFWLEYAEESMSKEAGADPRTPMNLVMAWILSRDLIPVEKKD